MIRDSSRQPAHDLSAAGRLSREGICGLTLARGDARRYYREDYYANALAIVAIGAITRRKRGEGF